jgi:hypothetical protein
MTESPEEIGTEREIGPKGLRVLVGCLAPVLLLVAGLRIASLVAAERRAAWLAGRSWPPEAISIFLRGPAPRPARRG